MSRAGERVACDTCDAKAGERCVRLWDTRRHSQRDAVPPLPRSHRARVLAETFNDLMPRLAQRIRNVPRCGHRAVVMSCPDCKSVDGLLLNGGSAVGPSSQPTQSAPTAQADPQ